RSRSFPESVPSREAFAAAGQTLLAALHPVPKGIRLLGLGLHNLSEGGPIAQPQLRLAI
ncbi:MAG TPA: DNA polymerase IV, partial [bacterium]|nr:DNA polymerase IV [bacterium]